MKHLISQIKIEVNENLYIKNPESSDLGKKIVEHSILLIDKIGFEQFTFRKLGKEIGSNESSVYRYFENKHKLLLYLTSWYWGWKEYQLVFSTANMDDKSAKLKKAVQVLTRQVEKDSFISHIDEVVLNRVVVNEFSKSYLTKEVDKENKEGFFAVYNRLVFRLKEMIEEVDKEYPYPASLASTILEGSLHQYFLKEHFPALTECSTKTLPSEYFTHMVFNVLNLKNNG
ncbi:transcriptional regulator, TetR family [Salinimicrobium catena]|uniref:Transcriptional regulator, TetR family n=1 Tax=Salinimicrobium catena TaxID=390640 RepID=A0A1H5NX06_9FLAO|nr:TetR/AcrR family transcriptional regulator [Salinimicrobium catena]SDL61145.1 transcriptional regulator, TetR family [Salinimicrobium catena]SEF05317.1 transcriptional regulator, TetR family [Salinimicrobium catena]